MAKPRKPKRGETWRRKRDGSVVIVHRIVDPYGAAPPVVVIEGLRISCVRLDRWHLDYTGPV